MYLADWEDVNQIWRSRWVKGTYLEIGSQIWRTSRDRVDNESRCSYWEYLPDIYWEKWSRQQDLKSYLDGFDRSLINERHLIKNI